MDKRLTIIFLLTLAIGLSSCGGGGGDSAPNNPPPPPPPPPVDSSPPEIVSISPDDTAENVELDSVITIQFNEAIDPSSVQPGDFQLTQNSNTVDGVFEFDSATHTITFTPSVNLQHSLEYQINLSSEISDLAGNSLASDMQSDFYTRGYRWSEPFKLNSNDVSVGEASIEIGPNDELIAHWVESVSSTKNIWASTYESTTGWAVPQSLLEDVNEQSRSAQLKYFMDGNLWGFWVSRDLETDMLTIKRSRRDVANSFWQNAEIVDDGANGPPSETRFRTSSDGSGMLFIVRNDGFNHSLFARSVSGGVISATESLLDSSNFGPTDNVVAGMDGFGNAIAVWTQWNGTKGAVYSNYFSANTGQWSAIPTRLDVGGSSSVFAGARYTKLAVAENGDAVAVWIEETTSGISIYANYYLLNSGWQGAQVLASGFSNITYFPNVDIFPNGDAIAVWDEGNGSGGLQVTYRLLRSGIWQSAVPLATNGYSNYGPIVATSSNGEAVVAWGHVEESLGKSAIYAARYNQNNGFSLEEKVSKNLDNSQNYLSQQDYGDDERSLAIDSQGVATIVWRETGNGPSNVYMSKIE